MVSNIKNIILNGKANSILQLVRTGRANDVLSLMEGESIYATEASEGAPTDNVLGQLWIGALYHLRFITEFGIEALPQVKNGRIESPFPEVFMEWLEAGAPGIGSSDLDNYLRENPIRWR